MSSIYLDSMAINHHFGKPTLFVTMTGNSKWSEVVDQLQSGQTAADVPHLLTCVFRMK